MYNKTVFKFCQTYGNLHQWASKIPWQYLGSEIYITKLISQNIGVIEVTVSLYVEKLWRTCPPVFPKTRSMYCGVAYLL